MKFRNFFKSPSGRCADSALTSSELDAVRFFSWKLFNQVRTGSRNLVLSPLSAFLAMGMAANGASGKTLLQIENALGLPLQKINRLSQSLLEQPVHEQTQLHTANSLWISEKTGMSLKPDFVAVLNKDYQAIAKEVPFDSSTVREVNSWVSEKTDGMIDQMVDHFTDPELVLINAISFDALWETPYEQDEIVSDSFHNADGTESEVRMMNSTEDEYIETSQFRGFLKPYQNGAYILAALLPKEESPEHALENALDQQDERELSEALNSPTSRTVFASLPEFMISCEEKLIDALQVLGITDAFDGRADFSNMTADSSFMLSDVFQKAAIEVDAKGARAAAATAIVECLGVPSYLFDSETITCDRPFLYMILEAESKIPVFIGTFQHAEQ